MFTVQPWSWSPNDGVLTCRYETSSAKFEEIFAFEVEGDADELLARAFDLLAITAGVSYFKTDFSNAICLHVGESEVWSTYVSELYDKGLREFRFQNGLELEWLPTVTFSGARLNLSQTNRNLAGALLPMGGGRDSLLTAIALKSITPTLMTVGDNPIVNLQAKQLGLDVWKVTRTIDPSLFEMNRGGATNGHIPITAINSCVAIVLALLLGRQDVVMSIESSASTPTRIINGVDVNHQYSKSWDFEKLMREMLSSLEVPINYFSVLRHLGELDISQILARNWELLPPFVSCNRSRTLDRTSQFAIWCTHCAKCYFVYLALTPFLSRQVLIDHFGRDLLRETSDYVAVKQLLDRTRRDFECIGTIEEIEFALNAAARGDWSDVDWVRQLAQSARSERPNIDSGLSTYAIPSVYLALIGAQ